ncbi:hypothetical protein CBM2606_A160096 [Cupriavidus taiwanensis]|nr:hypothetical protein CBM2606_A160096 [Cupriavidus taiwanensis]
MEPCRRVQAGPGACHVPPALSEANPDKSTRTQDEKAAFDPRAGRRLHCRRARHGIRGGLPPRAGAGEHR